MILISLNEEWLRYSFDNREILSGPVLRQLADVLGKFWTLRESVGHPVQPRYVKVVKRLAQS